nr:MAG TPA: hypothetical protein [Caudoviricetes sp.]DAW69261.1 MAG TPA: hypothetical protein [Caudoviricetes sp.]
MNRRRRNAHQPVDLPYHRRRADGDCRVVGRRRVLT